MTVTGSTKVYAGGTLTIRAEHGGDTDPVSDGTVLSSDAADNSVVLTYSGGGDGRPARPGHRRHRSPSPPAAA